MANIDATPLQQVLDGAKRQRVTDVEQNRGPDNLLADFDLAKGAVFGHPARLCDGCARLK